jgi:hypothetical protein
MAFSHAPPQAQRHVPEIHYTDEGILGIRSAAGYNPAERQYSALLGRRIEQLLSGRRNSLLLLRKYPADPARLGAMATPDRLPRSALRIPIIEKMAMDTIVFLTDRSPGGPVAQETDGDGVLVETRKYPTKYPHIVIERVDRYRAGSGEPESIQWCARRVQNQRASTQINRMLDAANLGLDVLRFFLH